MSAGYAGRQRAVDALADQQHALDAEAEGRDLGDDWRNLADVSDLIKARNKVYREAGMPTAARAELAVLWALNANSNFAVFWLLLRILSTEGLLEDIRSELAPYAKVVANTDGFGIQQAKVSIDQKGLVSACPLLKASFIESMRLDSATWSLKKLKQDVQITADGGGTDGQGKTAGRSYQLKAGSYIEVPFDQHFSDPKYFPEPAVYRPLRHIVAATPNITGNPKSTAEWGSVRAFGGGTHRCPGRLYAEQEVLACVGGILSLWDFEPIGSKWQLPKSKKSTGPMMPTEDVRVRIRRRSFA